MKKDYIELNKSINVVLSNIKTIKKNLIVIFIISILFAGFSLLIKPKKTYTSTKTLMLTGSNEGSQLLSIANSFGFGGGSQKVTYDKFKNVSFSNNIISKSLCSKPQGSDEFLGNSIISSFRLSEIFESSGLKNINFGENTLKTDTAIGILIPIVINALNIQDKGEIIQVSFKSGKHDLSQKFTTILLNNTIEYFQSVYFQKNLSVQKVISAKLDSIKNVLMKKEILYAQYKDANLGYVKVKGKLKHLQLKRDIEILNEIMVETAKQFELINFKLLNVDIGIEYIDKKDYPMLNEETSTLKKIIISGLIGWVLGAFLIVIYSNIKSLRPRIKELYRNS